MVAYLVGNGVQIRNVEMWKCAGVQDVRLIRPHSPSVRQAEVKGQTGQMDSWGKRDPVCASGLGSDKAESSRPACMPSTHKTLNFKFQGLGTLIGLTWGPCPGKQATYMYGFIKIVSSSKETVSPKGNQNMGRPLCQIFKLEIDILVGELVPCLHRLKAQALVFEPGVMRCRGWCSVGQLIVLGNSNNAKAAPGPLMRLSPETLCSLLSGQDGVELADGASEEAAKRSPRNQQKMQRPALIPRLPRCS